MSSAGQEPHLRDPIAYLQSITVPTIDDLEGREQQRMHPSAEQYAAIHAGEPGATQDHWASLAMDLHTNHRAFVAPDGEVYRIGPERDCAGRRGHFGRGFGGHPFLIEFADGVKVRTSNLWHAGSAPDVRFVPTARKGTYRPIMDFDESHRVTYRWPDPHGNLPMAISSNDPRVIEWLNSRALDTLLELDAKGRRCIFAEREGGRRYLGRIVDATDQWTIQNVDGVAVLHDTRSLSHKPDMFQSRCIIDYTNERGTVTELESLAMRIAIVGNISKDGDLIASAVAATYARRLSDSGVTLVLTANSAEERRAIEEAEMHNCAVYLPWRGFEGYGESSSTIIAPSQFTKQRGGYAPEISAAIWERAQRESVQVSPRLADAKPAATTIAACRWLQMHGADGASPPDLVLAAGNNPQALFYAGAQHVPVVLLRDREALDRLDRFCSDLAHGASPREALHQLVPNERAVSDTRIALER